MKLYDLLKYHVHGDTKATEEDYKSYTGHIDGEGYKDQWQLLASFPHKDDAISMMNFLNRKKDHYSWYEVHVKLDGKYTGESYYSKGETKWVK